MKKLILVLTMILTLGARAEETKSLEGRIAELEAQSSLNIFKLSGILETRFDSMKSKETTPGVAPLGTPIDDKVDLFRIRTSLNVDADVSPSIKFYSRYTATQFMNVFGAQPVGSGTRQPLAASTSEARDDKGSQVYVEKAYADVNIGESGVTFSFGRLPTVDGPPLHFVDGRPRSGTYPALAYYTSLDGYALTYNKSIDSNSSFGARVVYSPLTTVTVGEGKLFTPPSYVTEPKVTSTGQKIDPTSDIATLMFEYNRKFGIVGDFGVVYQGYSLTNVTIDGAALNSTGALAGGGVGTGAVDFKIAVNTLTAELSNIANKDVQVSVSHLQSVVENSGVILLPPGIPIYGYGAASQNEKATGRTTLYAARYGLTPALALGTEYVDGGKNSFLFDTSARELVSFYSTPGTGTHYYVSYKYKPELALRLGTTNQKFKATPMTIGASPNTDRVIDTVYANLRLDF